VRGVGGVQLDRRGDRLTVGGARPLRGTVHVPGDKSISHRALLLAGIAEGTSSLRGLASGEDVRRSRIALKLLGVPVSSRPDGLRVIGRGWDGLHEPDSIIDCGNSGTSIRLLAGLLAGRPFLSVLTGDSSIRRRPMARVAEPLRMMGARIDGREGGALAPLTVRGGSLHGGAHRLQVASAQVKSAILLAGLQARGETTVVEPFRSRDHTERMVSALGGKVTVDGEQVTARASALRPFDLDVPGDPSSAAFFVVAALITPGSEIELPGVCANPTRTGFLAVLRRMGADIEVHPMGERCGEPVADLVVRSSALVATTVGGAEVPSLIDEIPVLAAAAACADGITEFHDAGELRVKETDRISAIAEELGRFGVAVETSSDGLAVTGGQPAPGSAHSRGDHRMAMTAAVLGHACTGETVVEGWRATATSYPGFADDLARLVA
jgi:3-phosphoshikimate 1-carboxyvinyltransferase